jgi:hypothetical protein
MFPDLAGETVTDQVLWTPARLRACGAWTHPAAGKQLGRLGGDINSATPADGFHSVNTALSSTLDNVYYV